MFKHKNMSSQAADIAQESFTIPAPWPPRGIRDPVGIVEWGKIGSSSSLEFHAQRTVREEAGTDCEWLKRPCDPSMEYESEPPPDKRARIEEPDRDPSTSTAQTICNPPSTSRAVVEYVNPIPPPLPGIVPQIGISPAVSRLLNGVVPNKENADKLLKQYVLEHGNIRIIDFYRDVLFPTRGLSGNDRQDLARYEMAVIEKAETAFVAKKPFGSALCNEIVSVSDDTFDLILSRHSDISVENINMITTYAWAKNSEGELRTDNKRKFIAIARYGLLPKLVNVGSNIRNLFTSYEKLVAIDQDLVMDHLLLPLLDTNGTIPKPLYHGVNTHKFLIKILDRMSSSFTTLTDGNMITTLTFLIDKEREYLHPPASNTLFKILEISLQTRSTDTKIATFYHLIVKKFIYTMADDEVKQLHSLNYYNQTFLKESIDKLVDERLQSHRNPLVKALVLKPNVFRAEEPVDLRREQPVVFRRANDYDPINGQPNGQNEFGMSMEID